MRRGREEKRMKVLKVCGRRRRRRRQKKKSKRKKNKKNKNKNIIVWILNLL